MTDHDRNMDFPKGTPGKATMMTSIATPSTPESRLPRLSDKKLEKVPQSLQAPYRSKAKTSVYLNKSFPLVEGLCFKNMAEAQASMALAQWHAPQDDSTIPQTDEEHCAYARKLVHAFKDMTIAKDTKTNAYRKRFTPGDGVYYKDWAIEACAWDVIAMAKAIHTEGFKAPIYDKAMVDYIGQTQNWLFEERIDWICQVLRSSKHVGVTLMKNEKNWTTVGAPHKLYSSTLVNCISNAHRGKWIKNGRDSDQSHQDRPIKAKRTKAELAASNDDGVGMDHAINENPGAAAEGDQMDVEHQEHTRKRQKVKHVASDGEGVGSDRAFIVDSEGIVTALNKTSKQSKYASNAASTDTTLPHGPTALPQAPTSVSRSNELHPDAEIIKLMHEELPKKHVAVVSGQGTGKDSTHAGDVISKNTDQAKSPCQSRRGLNKESSVRVKNKGFGFTNYHSNAGFKDEYESDNDSELSEAPDGLFSDACSASPESIAKCSFSTLEPRVHDAADLDGARMLASLHTGR